MGNCCVIEKKEPEIEINKINFDDTPILIYEKEETPKSDKNIFNIDIISKRMKKKKLQHQII